MCGHAPAIVSASLPNWQPSPTIAKPARPTVVVSAAETLIQHLVLTPRLAAEVHDLYSRPIARSVVPLASSDRQSKRPSRPVTPEPEREAA